MYEIKQIIQDKPFVREIESLNEEKKKSLFLRNCNRYILKKSGRTTSY